MADYRVIDAEQLDADLTAVAEAIRGQSGGTEPLAFPEGLISGVQAAGNKRFSDGEQAAYDAFWDAHQINGTRTDYRYAFAGEGWSAMAKAGKFLPKYPIKPKNVYKYQSPAYGMFLYFNVSGSAPVDLSGVEMDFSGCTEANRTFANCYLENIVCDFGNCWQMDQTFIASDTNARGVNKVRLRVTETLTNGSLIFGYCPKLVDLEFFGDSVIACNGFTFERSRNLSRKSIENVMEVLSDSTSGLVVTFNLGAVNKAFETSEGALDGTESADWAALLAAKPNWTVNLEDV